MWGIRVLLLLAAGLALADASVVTLALPPIIAELDASVEQAAAVLGVYTLALAVALPLVTRLPARSLALGGALLFALASAGCGLADSITALLVLRGAQALGGAALLVGAFTLVDAGGAGRRAWTAVAIFGFAAGPALGGALTQAFDWRAIFLAQVPIALAAASIVAFSPATVEKSTLDPGPPRSMPEVRSARSSRSRSSPPRSSASSSCSCCCSSPAGRSTPLAAAAAVTVLPVAAVAAARISGPARTRAAAGALLVAGGVLALAFAPRRLAVVDRAPAGDGGRRARPRPARAGRRPAARGHRRAGGATCWPSGTPASPSR